MFKGYFITHSSQAQVESNAIINIRFGGTCFGFGTAKQIRERKKTSKFNPFPIRLEFLRDRCQCRMIEVFRIGCAWLSIAYVTKGEVTPDSHWADSIGWQFYHN